MKDIRLYNRLFTAIGIIAGMALTSCQQKEGPLSPENKMFTIQASIEQPQSTSDTDTKTYLGTPTSTAYPILWGTVDAIKVYSTDDVGYTFNISGGISTKSATFSGTFSGTPAYAIYPASMAGDTPTSITIPATQTYKAGGIADNSLPMMAVYSDGVLDFKHICGILRLSVKTGADAILNSITVTSADNIAGTGTIAYNSGAPTISFTSGTSKSITLDCTGTTITLAADVAQDFFIVVPPTSNNFSISINTNYSPVKKSTSSANISRGKIKPMNQVSITSFTLNSTSNCYAISNGEWLNIPVARVNEYASGTTAEIAEDDEWIAEILWQTNASNASDVDNPYSGKVIRLSSAIGTGSSSSFSVNGLVDEGNAVVAIYKTDANHNKTGDILWTWHIWVTAVADGINAGTQGMTYNISNVFVMDRALGASSSSCNESYEQQTFGLYYQWGRKDPFPMPNSTASTCSTAVACYESNGSTVYSFPTPQTTTAALGTVANIIKNPTVFYGGLESNNYDWIYTNDQTELWGGTKTIYDPCPKGWKVPNNGTWDNITESSGTYHYGFNFKCGPSSELDWYSASGKITNTTGVISNVGIFASYWSSTVYENNTYVFYFNSTQVNPSWGCRSLGRPVRCQKI